MALGRPLKRPREGLGQLLHVLRLGRGLTQDRLAELAEVDRETISKMESSRGKAWKPQTARRVYEVLMREAEISREDSDAYIKHTGLEPSLYDQVKAAMVAERNTPRTPHIDTFITRAEPILRQIASAVGPDTAMGMLHGLVIASTYLTTQMRDRAGGTSPLVHRSAPRPRPDLGAVEHTETEYDRTPQNQQTNRARRAAP
jgi:transcriptional regulator with XRE-family HTH domain